MTVYTAKLRQGYLQPRRLGDNFAFAPDKLWEIARQRPSFDLDFTSGVAVNRGTLASGNLGTFTRPSSVKIVTNGTQLVSVAADTPALQLDPASGLWGLLMEPAATNLYLNSATPATQGIVVTAQQYTLSFYGTGTLTLSGASAAGPLVGAGAEPARVSLTFTPSAGALVLTLSGSISRPQLETGSVASSPIATTGVTATRNADSWIYTGTAFSDWYDQAGMTWVSSHTYTAGNNGGDQTGVWSASNGVANRGWGVRVTDNTDSYFQYRDDVTNASLSGNPSTNSTTTRISTFASLATRSGSEDGKTVQSNSTLLSYSPTAFDRLRIGAPSLVGGAAGSRPILIHRVTAFPPGSAQSRIQLLSTP